MLYSRSLLSILYMCVCVCVCVCACSVAQLCLILCDPMDCSLPGSSVHGISRQEYWSGLPFPSPGDLPDPGIELESPALAGRFFTTEPRGMPILYIILCICQSPTFLKHSLTSSSGAGILKPKDACSESWPLHPRMGMT